MDKYKLIKMQDEQSLQEIESLKDFKQVLSTYKSTVRMKLFYQWFGIIVASATVTGIVLWWNTSASETSPYNYSSTTDNSTVIEIDQGELPKFEIRSLTTDSSTYSIVDEAGMKEEETVTSYEEKKLTNTGEVVFTKAGAAYSLDSMMAILNARINEIASKRESGIIIVEFKVSQQGLINNAKVVKSNLPDYNQILIDFIEELPAWSPATLNGVPKTSTVSFPISIAIEPSK